MKNNYDAIILDTDDIVSDFVKVFDVLLQKDRRQSVGKARLPTLSMIVSNVIEAIKNNHDIDNELMMMALDIVLQDEDRLARNSQWYDIKAIPRVRRTILYEIIHFGKQLHTKLCEQQLYHNDFFPYHYQGWNGGSITVVLDQTHEVPRNATR